MPTDLFLSFLGRLQTVRVSLISPFYDKSTDRNLQLSGPHHGQTPGQCLKKIYIYYVGSTQLGSSHDKRKQNTKKQNGVQLPTNNDKKLF